MSSIEDTPHHHPLEDLLDRIERIAEARGQAGAGPYFPLGADPACASYFVAVGERSDAPVYDYPGGGSAVGLIDALSDHWRSGGDDDLATLAAPLQPVAKVLRDEGVAQDASPGVFCYAMF